MGMPPGTFPQQALIYDFIADPEPDNRFNGWRAYPDGWPARLSRLFVTPDRQ